MAAKKKVSATERARRLSNVLEMNRQLSTELKRFLALEETDALEELRECVKALRTIANAPDGTPGVNLRGTARGVLARTCIGLKDSR